MHQETGQLVSSAGGWQRHCSFTEAASSLLDVHIHDCPMSEHQGTDEELITWTVGTTTSASCREPEKPSGCLSPEDTAFMGKKDNLASSAIKHN